jgi:uncharacterized membrane protein
VIEGGASELHDGASTTLAKKGCVADRMGSRISATAVIASLMVLVSIYLGYLGLSGDVAAIRTIRVITRHICHQSRGLSISASPSFFSSLLANPIASILCMRCWGIYTGLFSAFLLSVALHVRPRYFAPTTMLSAGILVSLLERFALDFHSSTTRYSSGLILGIGIGCVLYSGIKLIEGGCHSVRD